MDDELQDLLWYFVWWQVVQDLIVEFKVGDLVFYMWLVEYFGMLIIVDGQQFIVCEFQSW